MDTGPLETVLGTLFWPMMILVMISPLKPRLTVKTKRGTVTLRLKESWTCLLIMAMAMMKLIVDLVHLSFGWAVFDIVVLLLYARFYRYAKDDEDKDDEDKKRKRVAKQVGEKSKALVRALVRNLKPSPAPRPVPVRN